MGLGFFYFHVMIQNHSNLQNSVVNITGNQQKYQDKLVMHKKNLYNFHNRSFWDKMAKIISSRFPCQWFASRRKAEQKLH